MRLQITKTFFWEGPRRLTKSFPAWDGPIPGSQEMVIFYDNNNGELDGVVADVYWEFQNFSVTATVILNAYKSESEPETLEEMTRWREAGFQ